MCLERLERWQQGTRLISLSRARCLTLRQSSIKTLVNSRAGGVAYVDFDSSRVDKTWLLMTLLGLLYQGAVVTESVVTAQVKRRKTFIKFPNCDTGDCKTNKQHLSWLPSASVCILLKQVMGISVQTKLVFGTK